MGGTGGYGGMMGGGGYGIGLLGGFFMIIFWILVIVGVILLIRWLVGQSGAGGGHMMGMGGQMMAPPGNRAMETLKDRYAKGEIGKEEFDQMKKDLM